MKVIVDQNDPGYYETRALELIGEAKKCWKVVESINALQEVTPSNYQKQKDNRERYHECMKNAISLLGLARLGRSDGTSEEKVG